MSGRLFVGILGAIVVLVALGAVLAVFLAPMRYVGGATVASAATPEASGSPYIMVGGIGEVRAKPDVAYVTVGVQSQGTTAKEAQTETSRLMDAVLAKLKAVGIADKDIQTSGVNVYPVTGDAPDKITGYMASNSVTVTVNDIAKAGEVLDEAIAAGANTAGGISFGIKDDSQLRLQAVAQAVKNARPKADAIAQALGVQITGVRSVTEGATGSIPMYDKAYAASAPAGMGGAPIAPGELTISVPVTVVYSY